MERSSRYVDLPKIEAKKIFNKVIDYEIEMVKDIANDNYELCKGLSYDEYYKIFYKEYVKLFLDRSRIIERRQKK